MKSFLVRHEDLEAQAMALHSWNLLQPSGLCGLKLTRLRRQLLPAYEEVYKARAALIDRHAKRSPDGTIVRPRDDAGQERLDGVEIVDPIAFREEITALMHGTVEIRVQPFTDADVTGQPLPRADELECLLIYFEEPPDA
jgi:hypothetical protein